MNHTTRRYTSMTALAIIILVAAIIALLAGLIELIG